MVLSPLFGYIDLFQCLYYAIILTTILFNNWKPGVILFAYNYFGYSRNFCFHMHFKIFFLNFGILIGIAFNL